MVFFLGVPAVWRIQELVVAARFSGQAAIVTRKKVGASPRTAIWIPDATRFGEVATRSGDSVIRLARGVL